MTEIEWKAKSRGGIKSLSKREKIRSEIRATLYSVELMEARLFHIDIIIDDLQERLATAEAAACGMKPLLSQPDIWVKDGSIQPSLFELDKEQAPDKNAGCRPMSARDRTLHNIQEMKLAEKARLKAWTPLGPPPPPKTDEKKKTIPELDRELSEARNDKQNLPGRVNAARVAIERLKKEFETESNMRFVAASKAPVILEKEPSKKELQKAVASKKHKKGAVVKDVSKRSNAIQGGINKAPGLRWGGTPNELNQLERAKEIAAALTKRRRRPKSARERDSHSFISRPMRTPSDEPNIGQYVYGGFKLDDPSGRVESSVLKGHSLKGVEALRLCSAWRTANMNGGAIQAAGGLGSIARTGKVLGRLGPSVPQFELTKHRPASARAAEGKAAHAQSLRKPRFYFDPE